MSAYKGYGSSDWYSYIRRAEMMGNYCTTVEGNCLKCQYFNTCTGLRRYKLLTTSPYDMRTKDLANILQRLEKIKTEEYNIYE